MVKVGDQFKCDKISLVGKEKATPTMYGYESKTFSKGVFTLLDLGPPPWRNVWYDHYVKAKDCNGTEGWIDIKDFDSYKRGYKYSPDGIIKRWMSSDQLKQGRSERDETQRKETERVEQEKRKQKEKENQTEASSSTASILLPHLKPRDRTASGGSTSRDLGIGSSSSKLSERGSRPSSGRWNPKARPRISSSSTNTASSGTSTPQSTKRKAEEIEQEHLKEVQRIRDEHEKERKKIRREQDREVKHLKLKHNVKIQEANLEEARKELEDFEAEEES